MLLYWIFLKQSEVQIKYLIFTQSIIYSFISDYNESRIAVFLLKNVLGLLSDYTD